METYFSKFPVITYNDVACRDITRRAVISESVRNSSTSYYPYEIKAGSRPDTIAQAYYEDFYYDWLIYLTNGIVDRYFGWYLSEQDFDKFIANKYGSHEKAINTILEYRLSSNNDDKDISVSFFENNIPSVLKKYYSPNYGAGSKVISYFLRQESWSVNTNVILQFETVLDTPLVAKDLIQFIYNSEVIARAEVVSFLNKTLIIKNFDVLTAIANYQPNDNYTFLSNTVLSDLSVRKRDTNTNYELVNSYRILHKNIPSEEFTYWEPLDAFTFEYEKNENNKKILLLDANFALEVAEQLRVIMKE